MTSHEKKVKPKSLILKVALLYLIVVYLIVVYLMFMFYMEEDKGKVGDGFIGYTSNPEYVAHGDVTPIPDSICYDNDVVGTTEFYTYYNGAIYKPKDSTEYKSSLPFIGGNDGPTEIRVDSSVNINSDGVKELITVISPSENSDIKVPLGLICSSKRVQLSSFLSVKIPKAIVIPISEICPDGKLILPQESEYALSETKSVHSKITESASGDSWVVSNRLYIHYYSLEVSDDVVIDREIPVLVDCHY